MSHFDYDYYPRRRPGILTIAIAAMAGAVIGGFLVLSLGSSILGLKPNNSQFPQQQSDLNGSKTEPLSPLSTGESPAVAISQRVGPSVVRVSNFSGRSFFNEQTVSEGSGVIFDSKQGYIVTNFHVIEGANKIVVALDEKRQYEAKLEGADSRTDLAVLKIVAQNLPEAEFGDSDQLQVGEMVVAIGNPLGREFARSVTMGVVSALNRQITVPVRENEETTLQVIQTDAAINPGNSGGALVNSRGQVVGINSAKIRRADVEGMGFAIPINNAQPTIQELIQKGFVSRPFIGIANFSEITEEMSQWYDIPVGIFVGQVISGGPAARAGMRDEDVIVQIDETRINSFEDLQKVLDSHKPGQQVTITIVRGSQQLELKVKLGELPRD
ncbi:MAG: S1C family serine protease [Bacillota bacterium]